MIQKVQWLSPEAEGREQRRVGLNGYRVSVLQDENVLGNSFTTMYTLSQCKYTKYYWTVHLKMVKMAIFMLCIFLPPPKKECSVAQSHPTLCDSMDCSPWDFLGKSTRVGCHFLLQKGLKKWMNDISEME